MSLPGDLLPLLRCPVCGAGFSAPEQSDGGPPGGALACGGNPAHTFAVEDGFLTFGRPPAGKYDPGYAGRYAALWAFGYQTLASGLDEPLYRTVSSLAAEALAAAGGREAVIVDAGCGVGRVAADCARLASAGVVLGIDGSLAMLELARRIACGNEPVAVDLAAYGFGTLTIPARACANLHLLRADVENLPVADGAADLALSVNVIDRLPRGPERAFAECHRVLRRGGHLVFTDPLNWTEPDLWRRWGDRDAVLGALAAAGFTVETAFDRLLYREILDQRGSVEEFTTLAVLARKG